MIFSRKTFRHCIVLFLFLFPLISFAQVKSVQTSLSFCNNAMKLRKDAKQTLDKTLDTVSFSSVFKVVVSGATDYNAKLFEGRMQSIQSYLVSKGINEKMIEAGQSTIGNGKDKKSHNRVELIIYYRSGAIPHKAAPDKKPPGTGRIDKE